MQWRKVLPISVPKRDKCWHRVYSWIAGGLLVLSGGISTYANVSSDLPQDERALITFTGTWSGYWFRFADGAIVYEQVPMIDLERESSDEYDGGIILDGHYVIQETIRHAEGRLLEVALYDAEGQLLTRVTSPNGQPTFELTVRFEFDSITDPFHRFRAIQSAQITKKLKTKVGPGEVEVTIPQGPKGKAKLACLGFSDSPNGPPREEERGQVQVNTCDGSSITLTKTCLAGSEFQIPSGEAANGMVCVKDDERLRLQESSCSIAACQHGTITWKQTIFPMVRHAVVHWVDKDGNQVGGPKTYDLPFTLYSKCVCDQRLQPCPPPCPPGNCSAVVRVVNLNLRRLDGVEVSLSGTQGQHHAVSRGGLVVFPNLAAGQYRVAVNPESLRSLGLDPNRTRVVIVPETLMVPEPCPTATAQVSQSVIILIFEQ